tara:strand:+ start:5739 stop:6257 length:519 start_codon:yes stop_codon:yes gene_type:complete
LKYKVNSTKWIVVYTKPKHEKVVRDELLKNKFEVYLPLLRKRRKWSDRKKWVEFPLFRSYLFIKTDPKHSIQISKTNGVVRIVKFGEKIALVSDKELDAINKMVEGGFEPRAENYFLKGNPVIVEHGPLKGLVGEVLSIENQNRLVMRIDAIQQCLSVKIDQGYLKLIDNIK